MKRVKAPSPRSNKFTPRATHGERRAAKMRTVVALYLLLLLGHAAHVCEEVWGRFWLIRVYHGLGWFLAANGVLFAVPAIMLYFVVLGRRIGYRFAAVYSIIMILNGLGHNAATVITGRYFDGFAGGYTGIALIVTGSAMLWCLARTLRNLSPALPETGRTLLPPEGATWAPSCRGGGSQAPKTLD